VRKERQGKKRIRKRTRKEKKERKRVNERAGELNQGRGGEGTKTGKKVEGREIERRGRWKIE